MVVQVFEVRAGTKSEEVEASRVSQGLCGSSGISGWHQQQTCKQGRADRSQHEGSEPRTRYEEYRLFERELEMPEAPASG